MNVYKSVIVSMIALSISICASDLKEEGITVIKIEIPKVESATKVIAKPIKVDSVVETPPKATTDIAKVKLIVVNPQETVEKTLKNKDDQIKKIDNNSFEK